MTYRRYRIWRTGRLLAAALVLVTLAFVAAGAAARSQRTAEAAGPKVVADGVTAAGVDLSGLTGAEARRKLRHFTTRPVRLAFRSETWRFTPQTLGASADVGGAVQAALTAPAGSDVRLDVEVDQRSLRRWTRRFAREFERTARNAKIELRGLRPVARRSHFGRSLYGFQLQSMLTSELRAKDRGPLQIPAKIVQPRVTLDDLGPAIVIRRASNRLILYRGAGPNGMRVERRFKVATGTASYPTPLGSFTVVDKQRDPWWYPPDSDWAAGASPVPPGPGNPLGTRWMGLSEPLIGIHGTPDAASIGYSASHGCVRMLVPEAEWLFERVEEGTPVFILDA